MPTRLAHISRTAALIALASVLCAWCAAAATAAPSAAPSTADDDPVTTTLTIIGPTHGRAAFNLNPTDKRALRDYRKGDALQSAASQARQNAEVQSERIGRIEALITSAEGDEQRLQHQLRQLAVERYKAGSETPYAFLLDGGDIGGVLDRARIAGSQADQDEQLARDHELTLERLEDLKLALSELRDSDGDRAMRLDDRAAGLVSNLEPARVGHLEAAMDADSDAGIDGTWYIMNSDFSMANISNFSSFLPSGPQWGGGTRTPARPASPEQVARVLNDPRIEIYPGGITDMQAGRLDGRLLDALSLLADRFGHVIVTSMMTGHGTFTANGNVSEHSMGCAMDIGTIGSTYINRASQVPGGQVDQAVRYLAGLTGDLAPHQVISLFALGGATMSMPDHDDHIHVGYAC